MTVVCERFDSLGLDNPDRHYRLGIMGGTFDPIHVGHLSCAEEMRDALNLDAVVFIPTAQPVFKRDRKVAPAHHRLEMARLAVQDNPCFDVSSLEIDRGGDTYTVDTLHTLRDHYPQNVELYFITGSDALSTVPQWRRSEEFGALATFVGVSRPGYAITEEDKQKLQRKQPTLKVLFMQATALAVSSSALRQRMEEGKSIRYLLPACVRAYIEEHALYHRGDY